MFEIIKPGTKIDFVGKRHIWLGLSVVAMVGTIALFFTKGLNYGIDFTGGAEVQVHVPAGWDIGKLRSELESGGIKSPKVQQVGEVKESSFLIKVQGDESTLKLVSGQVDAALSKTLKKGEYEVQRADVVGPAAGGSLRQSGFLSMFYALLCILIYVTVRFDYRYSPGAVLALVHDTLITMGVFIITQKQFDLQILAAILALIGYSNNDTIIVFDRVRETIHANPKLAISDAVNKSINDTLGRTILTSASTFLTVFSLWLFGGKVIEDFAFTLMVGIVIGTYSSIFIASSAVIYMSNYYDSRRGSPKAKREKKSQLRRPRSAELESSSASS
jgi:preprotein translocase subunit SecF